MTWTRRRLRERGSTALAAAALAGCPSGSGTGIAGGEWPATDLAGFAEWLPAPSELSLRGSGFADAEGTDRTGAGPLQGPVSSDSGLVAGDSVVVGVTSDYGVRVVWEANDGDVTATLDSDQRPDA